MQGLTAWVAFTLQEHSQSKSRKDFAHKKPTWASPPLVDGSHQQPEKGPGWIFAKWKTAF